MEDILDERSVDSEEEAKKYDYGLYLMKRLIQIKRAQANRKRLETLLRSFYRWSYEFPLALKCDEMSKQLKERNLMMDTVRSSYLRDVVSIKHQLDKINDAEVDNTDTSLVKLKQNMYDLHTLPSVDLRTLVENVRQSVGQTSAQLRESLVDAGLLDPETLRTLNPWDQSRGFRRIMRIKKGGACKPPDMEGESFSIAAPSNKKLFVRYCKDCIGMAIFIKGWNSEVEESLKFKADFANIDNHIQEYRNLIGKLNVTIEHQEKQIVDLLDRTHKLETANAWFEKWGGGRDASKGGKLSAMDDFEARNMYKNMSEMARAELESFAFNSSLRVQEKERALLAAEKIQRQKLRAAELGKDADSKERLKIVQDFRKTQVELTSKINEIMHLTNLNAVKEDEKLALSTKLSASEADNTKLHEIVDRKEAEYATLRVETNLKIEDLNYQIKQLNDDYNNQENTIDELRENVSGKKALLSEYLQEINNLKKKIKELEALIPPPKRRYTLRSVIWAIRYLVRLRRLLASKNLKALGRLGYNELLRRQEKYIKLLNNANEKLQRRVLIADESFLFQQAEMESYRAVLQEKKVELVDHTELKQVLRRTQSLLRASEREKEEILALSAETVEAQNVVINHRVHVALEGQHDYHLQQAKVYAQIQRNLGHHLAQSLFRVRTVISTLDIDAEIAKLTKKYESTSVSAGTSHNASFSGPADLSIRPPTPVALPKLKAKQLALAVKTKSRQLISWIKKNRNLAVLMPKKVPVILFKQPSGSTARDIYETRKLKARELSVMTHVITHDFQHAEEVRKSADADIRKVQDYVLAMKNKHNELLQVIRNLEEELREERMPSQSSRAPRKRIGDIKSSYSHLINSTDTDHQNSYFSNVLSAIESVQAEHGDVYKDKLVKSGKFKLSDVAKTVVRRTSVSSKGGTTVHMKPGGSISSASDKIGFEDTPVHSRSSSMANPFPAPTRAASVVMPNGGYPLNKLDSLIEIDHDHHDHDHHGGEHAEHHETYKRGPSMPTIASASAATQSSSLHESSLDKLNVLVPELNPLNPPSIILEDFTDDDRRSSKKGDRQSSFNDGQTGAEDREEMWADVGLHDSSVLSVGSAGIHGIAAEVDTEALSHTVDGGNQHSAAPYVAAPHASSHTVSHTPLNSTAQSAFQPAPHAQPHEPSHANLHAVALHAAPLSASSTQAGPAPSVHVVGAPQVEHIDMERLHLTKPALTRGVSFGSPSVLAGGLDGSPQHGAPDTERSFGFMVESPVTPVAPPHPLNSQESAVGFDTIGFEGEEGPYGGEDGGGASVDEEIDEDVLYMEDLMAAKDEMVGLLTREEVIQNKIKAAEEYKLLLEGQVKDLEWRLEKKEMEYDELEERVFTISGDQKQLQTEFENLTHQNGLLREIVEEDYRHHAANLEKAIQEREEKERIRLRRKFPTVSQSTQVSCAVCAIRDEGLQPTAHRPQHGYDDATVAMVNESFTRALNGEVVLIAQPRRINGPKKARMIAPPEPVRTPAMAAFEEIREGIRTMELARPGKTPGGALEQADRDGIQLLDRNSPGFSEALIKHMESNQFQSMMNSNSAGNSKPSSANKNGPAASSTPAGEGSKFSRIKKMPAKGSTSSGDLNNGAGTSSGLKAGLPPTRPHSAVALQKKNIEQRTESNTAAYLQNQLMVGYGSSPQFAPIFTEPVVPLHTVDASSGRPDSTAAYLAHAVSKQRASSASAARTEHTTSANLLLYRLEEQGNGLGSGASSARSKNRVDKAPKRLQLDLHVPVPHQGSGNARNLQHFSADITDEMSDGVADEFI